ncbi:hypothetical protein R3I94_014098 [Phoxinus phoxinus]
MEQQLDLDPGVATRIMDKLKKMFRGSRRWVLTVCLGIICVLLVVVIIYQQNNILHHQNNIIHQQNNIKHQQNIIMHQQNKIKEQKEHSLKQTDNSNVLRVGSFIIKAAKLWIDPSGTLGKILSTVSEVVDVVK